MTSEPEPDEAEPEQAGTAQAEPDDSVEFPDVVRLSYEGARDELTSIVARLESGQVPLEESMRLWRRGEALAAHCSAWLDGAQRQIIEAGLVEGRS